MRILISPSGLRTAARTLRGASHEVDSLGLGITSVQVPEMPGGQQGQLQARLRTVGATVRHSGIPLTTTANDLEARARNAMLASEGADFSAFGSIDPTFSFAKYLLGNWDKKQFFSPYFDGYRYIYNPRGKVTGKGVGKGLVFGQAKKGYTPGQLKEYQKYGPGGEKVSKGVYFNTEGSAAARRWGGDGPVQVAAAEVSASAKGGITKEKGEYKAAAEAAVAANLLRVSVKKHFGHAGTLEGGASVGANARAKAVVGYDKKKGVEIGTSGSAFAGGEGHVTYSNQVSGLKSKATAGASYGIGGNFDGEAGYRKGVFKARFKLGATIGVGANAGVEVEVDPAQVGKDAFKEGYTHGRGIKSVLNRFF